MKFPKVFVSYSHDTQEHKKWVLELAIRMRQNGIDAVLDQWDLTPGDDLPHFMETHLAAADFIIMICTDKYVEKANAGVGGVGYEKMIITSSLMSRINESKIIPIIRQAGTTDVPVFLKTKMYINFSHQDDFESVYDDLIRKIHQSPLFEKPPIGNKPFEVASPNSTTPKHDTLKEVMRVIMVLFEVGGRDYIDYDQLRAQIPGMSRTMLDVVLADAQSKDYVSRDRTIGVIWIRDAGKKYALDNELV